MADNETTTDIIAWLRKPREGENAYLTLWRDEIADRLEAAHKRAKAAVGDVAKLREALVRFTEWYKITSIRTACLRTIAEIARAALAAPARNCDVGTPEEQVARYHAFCAKMMKQNNHCCGPCPCHEFVNGEAQACTILWAQMPYEEGGDK